VATTGKRTRSKAVAGAAGNGRGPRTSPTGASASGKVVVTRETDHLVATLDRPAAANRITAAMSRRLIDLAEEVEDDPEIAFLIVTGSGRDFCAGFEPDADPALVETLAIISKPTLALINGDALDEGLELAMALDLRMAFAAGRFALTQLERGTLPCFGGTQRLPRLIGGAQALRMLLTGAPINGREAMRLGLVTYLAKDRADLARAARDLIGVLASRGSLATQMVKDAVRKGYDMTLDQGIRLEEDLYALLQTTADRAEGVRAFLEKRKPLFKGA
jgi:enoyl-CoA hydratase/carnithine racemase